MKILMFFAKRFVCNPYEKVLDSAVESPESIAAESCVVVFYHVEPDDENRAKNVVSKLVKNIKWLAGKFESREIVLHSFNHLGTEKANPEVARSIISQVVEKLNRKNYIIKETPFGYQNEWIMHVAGESLAKVFKQL